ncbi:aminoacyl--tRNA ligase-related protein [Bacteroides heparinolyticus]|uniref:aminoacyl--tRNA ligase-related protein n=1 Tax=Prevotella heparinolytica TaxID=28113 RepID=UPI0035A1175F
MIVTLEYLHRRFEEFNKLCFNNTLVRPRLRISNTRSMLGSVRYKKERKLFGGVEYSGITLSISAFYDLTQEELDDYLQKMEEAKLRDHRKLGRELDLYTVSPLVGVGLPLFTPRGTVLRDVLANYSNQLRQKYGFQKVWTPHITKKELYEKSGHWAKFGDELFLVTSQETSDNFALKPMNCPHHTQIYASQPRSYRDLPVRYIETTTDYRGISTTFETSIAS